MCFSPTAKEMVGSELAVVLLWASYGLHDSLQLRALPLVPDPARTMRLPVLSLSSLGATRPAPPSSH